MFDASDYISMGILALIGIAAFLNLRRGTFGQWFQAKFLGRSTGSAAPSSSTGSTTAPPPLGTLPPLAGQGPVGSLSLQTSVP